MQAGAGDGDASDAAGSEVSDGGDRQESAEVRPEVDSAAPSAQACDLLKQDCPDRMACYPDPTFSGATRCIFPGSGGPLSPCLLHEECDIRAICIDVQRDGFTVCTPLCDPEAAVTGCQRGAPCRRLTNYGAGTCGL